jgi:hypothetical protein
MSVIEGYLEETDSKSGVGKRGPWTLYKGKVNGTWYSFGFNKPPVAKGDYGSFVTAEEKGYQVIKSATKMDAPAQPAPSASPRGDIGHLSATGDRNNSIVYQSSRKDALALVALLITQNALPVSEAKTKAGTAKRYEEIMALVDKLTVQYFYDVNTLRNLDRVQDGGADAPAPAALPEDAQTEPEAAATAEPDANW